MKCCCLFACTYYYLEGLNLNSSNLLLFLFVVNFRDPIFGIQFSPGPTWQTSNSAMRAFKRTVYVASHLALWVIRLGWVAELASKSFLRERIRLTQSAKGDAKRETEFITRSITATLSADKAIEILEKIRVNTQRIFNTTKDRQQRKFLKLARAKQASAVSYIDQTPQVDKNKWVINLSSRPLSDTEVSLLKKGLNFALIPSNIPVTEIVAKVESTMRTLDSEQADTVRRTVNVILQQAKPPKPNITKDMQEALINLKQDDTITVLPADKGRASVVQDTNTYHDKMKTLIETGPYQLSRKLPRQRGGWFQSYITLNFVIKSRITKNLFNQSRVTWKGVTTPS